jgi:D-ribose pyranose/furanose isomerase RbsD
MEVDLNIPAQDQNDNPQEVILNPTQPLGDFLKLIELLAWNDVVEEVILAQELQNNLPPPLAEEKQLMNLSCWDAASPNASC